MNTQTIKLDVTKRPTVAPVVNIGQGDKSGTILHAEIYDDGIPFTLTGYSVKFAMRSPHGAGYYECNGTVSGNVAMFTIDETYAATVAGVTDVAYVEVISGTTIICSTNRFRINVLESATENTDPNGAYTNGVARFLSQADSQLRTMLNQSEAELEDAIEDAAEAISETDAAVARANTAAEAAEGVVLQSMPTMSEHVKGGAKLGSGLIIDSDTLSLGKLTDSGNPVDGCAIASLDGEGWAEQRTTVGKNLLGKPYSLSARNGISFTVGDDGSIYLSGTTDSQPYYGYIKRFVAGDENFLVLDAGTYTVSLRKDGVLTSLSNMQLKATAYYEGGTSDTYTDSNGKITFTLSAQCGVALYFVTSIVGANLTGKYQIQVEAGSDVTSWEPYSGGVPGPNPSYPFPIEVCRGRNLLDVTDLASGFIGSTGSEETGTNYRRSKYIPIDAGQNYTYSGINEITGAYAAWYDASKTLISTVAETNGTMTLTAPLGATYLRLSLRAAYLDSSQLELGSTPSPYVPYGHVGVEAQGRNLLDASALHNGYIKSNGDVGGTSSSDYKYTEHIGVIGGLQYTASFSTSIASTSYYCAWYDSSKALISVFQPTSAQQTVTAPENAKYVRLSFGAGNQVMFEEGSTAHAYEPYYHSTIPIPLPLKSDGERWAGGLPDGTADALTVDSAGRWEWSNACDEAVFDGTGLGAVTYYASISDDVAGGYSLNYDSAIKNNVGNIAIGMCDSLICATNTSNTVSDRVLIGGDSGHNSFKVRVFIAKSELSTQDAAGVNAWLSAHPATLLYPLATPTTESGYVALPMLPNGCTVECPELAEVGVSWYIEGLRPVMQRISDERGYIEYLISEVVSQ